MQKKCFVCGEQKEIDEFYKHSKMPDGHLNKCKGCCKSQSKKRYKIKSQDEEWFLKERNRTRERYHRLSYRGKYTPSLSKKKVSMQKYYAKYPEKKKAKDLTSHFEVKEGYHNHHWSYNDEHMKDVIEIKLEDHYLLHRYTIYDQERKMFRTLKGVLLDTKERYIEYMHSIFEFESKVELDNKPRIITIPLF